MDFKSLILELNNQYSLGIGDDFSEDSIKLKMNKDTTITLSSPIEDNTVHLESIVYEIEDFVQKDFYQHLLAANTVESFPSGFYFALEPSSHCILLISRIELKTIDVDQFIEHLKNYLTTINEIEEKIYFWRIESFAHSQSSERKREKESLLILKI